MSETGWSVLGVSGPPTGAVSLLFSRRPGSAVGFQPEAMTAAVARLGQVLADVVAAHRGVRPVEQGAGDSFVIAFAPASDAVGCAARTLASSLQPVSVTGTRRGGAAAVWGRRS